MMIEREHAAMFKSTFPLETASVRDPAPMSWIGYSEAEKKEI